MHRDVEVYAERVDPAPGQARWACGSGYLLGARLVLTAAHTVCAGDVPLSTVKVRGEDGNLHAAAVVWHRPEDGIDTALLEVTGAEWPEPRWRHLVRYGQFVTDMAGQECEAVGYPRVVASPELRDSHQATGTINPRSLAKSGRYAMEIHNPPAGSTGDGSAWAGMSGAAVVCGGLLVGVVTTDPAGFDSRRLVITPMAALAADASFSALVETHTGTVPMLEPVEVADLAHRVEPAASSADLLRADLAVTPFRDRPELEHLLTWCDDPDWFSVRLVVGRGGQGKTRLARKLLETLTQRTDTIWTGLFLADHADLDKAAVLAEVTSPTLIVVDQADARSTSLDKLFAATAASKGKVRLLLLARTAGAWRTDRTAPAAHMEVLADDRIVLHLEPVDLDIVDRIDAWQQAAAAFAARLTSIEGYRQVAWSEVLPHLVPVFDPSESPTILTIQMDALATLLTAAEPSDGGSPATGSGRSAEDVLLSDEHRYWSRVAREHQVTLSPSVQRCLVAMATLWEASERSEARRVVAAALDRPEHDDAVITASEWLETLYQTSDGYWSGLRPDLLGEHLVVTALGPEGSCPDLIARTVAYASDSQLERGLTVLGRALPRYPVLRDVLYEATLAAGEGGARAAIAVATALPEPEPLLAAIRQYAAGAEVDTLIDLYDHLPVPSLLFAPLALTVLEDTVRQLREAVALDRAAYLPKLAASVTDLAVRLAESRRGDESLAVAQEAVDLHRELVAIDAPTYLPILAISVSNLASWFSRTGRMDQALAAAEESLSLYRDLDATAPGTYRARLAGSIQNHASMLRQSGRPAEALAATEDSVALCRDAAADDPDEHLPSLASAVNTLALALAATQRQDEAVAAAQEAVDIRRRLADANPDAHLPSLAQSLGNLALHLGETGRPVEALAAAQERVHVCRTLVEISRGAYLSDLAGAEQNLSIALAEVGRHDESAAAAGEAVDLFQELAESDRDTYLPHLAASLNNLVVRLTESEQREDEAMTAAIAAVNLFAELAETDRDTYLPSLAGSVGPLAYRLDDAGRHDEALSAAIAAANMFEELAAADPSRFHADLQGVLDLAKRLAATE